MNRTAVLLSVLFGVVLGTFVSAATAQRSDLPQRVAPDSTMPAPQGPIATWTMSVGNSVVGRTQIDVVGLCRSAIESGLVK